MNFSFWFYQWIFKISLAISFGFFEKYPKVVNKKNRKGHSKSKKTPSYGILSGTELSIDFKKVSNLFKDIDSGFVM
jgi:hypothetical protein